VAAGVVVVKGDRVLLVRMGGRGEPHFWTFPGGGMDLGEGVMACAEREALEEAGMRVRAERIVYVQEILDAKHHHVKFGVLCQSDPDEEPHIGNLVEGEDQFLHEARFVGQEEVAEMDVYPRMLRDAFWEDLAAGFPVMRHLGIRPIEEW
jgi:ADP-ribose pyrophosphatase YjhB (NUDIX family)